MGVLETTADCTFAPDKVATADSARATTAPLPKPLPEPESRAGLKDVRAYLADLQAQGQHAEVLAQVMSLLARMFDSSALLQKRLAALAKARYGQSTEQVTSAQLALLFEAALAEEAKEAEENGEPAPEPPLDPLPEPRPEPTPEPKKPQRRPGRNPLPEHLVRKIIEVKVPDELRACPTCGIERTCMGHETSELLEFVPASFIVHQIEREKLACKLCQEHVVIAPVVCKVIAGGMCGAGLLAQVVVSKYVDHCPLYRQVEIYKRQRVELSDSTLCAWIAQAAGPLLLLRVAKRIWELAVGCRHIGADDTGIRVLDADHEKGAKRGHFWIYLGYDEQGRPLWPAFRYTPDWTKKGPEEFLADFKGKLQGDGYKGWTAVINANPGATMVGCWAHTRRYFKDALDAKEMAAGIPFALIQKLYSIEAKARDKNLTVEERLALRQAESVPVMAELSKWRDAKRGKIRPKQKLGEAWTYLDNQWQALQQYLSDGALPIDNNFVENQIRPICLGKKNYLFAGNDEGAERAAIIYTVLATCKIAGAEPWAYLADVFLQLRQRDEKASIDDLLPGAWEERRKAGLAAAAELALAAVKSGTAA